MPKRNSVTDQTKNKKYVFAQRAEDEFTCIKITEGKFKDVIYKYGKVGFAPKENSDGALPMKFDYDIMKNPNNVDVDKQDFINFIGDILIDLLDEQIKTGNLNINE